MRTPVSTIRWAIKRCLDHEQEEANIKALATARLTTTLIQIAHGFSGSKSRLPKIQTKDFLPYPDWQPERQAADGPDEVTKYTLGQLVRTQRIPLHVFTALVSPVRRPD